MQARPGARANQEVRDLHLALPAIFAFFVLAVTPIASGASLGGHAGGGGGKPSCTPQTPSVSIDNTWQWGQFGSYGMPGQTLKYALNVINYDSGCGSSTFTVSLTAPSGFSVSSPQTITLKSGSSSYVWLTVTSPGTAADGDYRLTASLQRSTGPSSAAASTSYYKVYSNDSTAPTVYWPNPADGTTLSGSSYQFIVSSSDDHAVRTIELYIDNVYKSTATCEDIAYECQLAYKTALGASGQHTATFKSYDWMGNLGVLNTVFFVN